MNTMQYMKVGDFVVGIPQEKMFDVATLKIDIRPAIKNLRAQSIRWSLDKEPLKPIAKPTKVARVRCRQGCKNWFINNRRRKTHERKYHTTQPNNSQKGNTE